MTGKINNLELTLPRRKWQLPLLKRDILNPEYLDYIYSGTLNESTVTKPILSLFCQTWYSKQHMFIPQLHFIKTPQMWRSMGSEPKTSF